MPSRSICCSTAICGSARTRRDLGGPEHQPPPLGRARARPLLPPARPARRRLETLLAGYAPRRRADRAHRLRRRQSRKVAHRLQDAGAPRRRRSHLVRRELNILEGGPATANLCYARRRERQPMKITDIPKLASVVALAAALLPIAAVAQEAPAARDVTFKQVAASTSIFCSSSPPRMRSSSPRRTACW